MFLQLANIVQSLYPSAKPVEVADTVLGIDARTLRYVLDRSWESSGRSGLTGLPLPTPTSPVVEMRVVDGAAVEPHLHLIYAYMIEQTGIHRVFRRALSELLEGERMGLPVSPGTLRWMATTEDLFFRDGAFHPISLTSAVRTDQEAARRNAYYRMFGMDLNHGGEGGAAYQYVKPQAANRAFVTTFEDFLREVWQGIENASNTSGANKTDNSAIENLALRLENMLNARRGGTPTAGLLARDEFVHVSTMQWFALTVSADTAVVRDLKAGAPSPEERLQQIGQRVGIPSHARSHSYFQLAVPLAILLLEIEAGTYSAAGSASTLYAPGPIRDSMQLIITHWSAVTGRDLKAPRVTVGQAQPPIPASPATVAGTGPTNGRTAAPVGG